ncbi:MAG: amidohydrolase family protein [Silvibacterium sp.]|nr:amidohydrolase family protein [Silvibacterium sp.]
MKPITRAAIGLLLMLLGLSARAADHSTTLVCAGAKVYPSPTAPPIDNAVLIVGEGRIVTVAPRNAAKYYDLPGSALKLDCVGKVVVAGFWNSHVHFTSGWDGAATAPAAKLQTQMQEMLTRWGFTTVWDLGSTPEDTMALRRRVDAGEIQGPKILMAGDIFPKGGHPVYLPAEMKLPQAATPQEAGQMAKGYMAMGLDGIKLFTGAYMGDKPVINMDTAIVKAAVDVAHAQGKPVFAHPQNRVGMENALNGGVDILAHTIPEWGFAFTTADLAQMKRQHTALIPTLTLWTTVVPDTQIQDQLVQAGVSELKAYFSEGGTVLFGTDVGFITKYDTSQEFEFMGRAMGWGDVLASLTTNPSAYFKAPTKGRVEKGMDADLVILDADPATDVRNLAKVAYTIRGGKVIYQK